MYYFFAGCLRQLAIVNGSPGGVWCIVGENDIRFLFCELFGPVNRRQNGKSWERRGEKLKGLINHIIKSTYQP